MIMIKVARQAHRQMQGARSGAGAIGVKEGVVCVLNLEEFVKIIQFVLMKPAEPGK